MNDRWYRDRWLWAALFVALALRVVPPLVWGEGGCIRDECAYTSLAWDIYQGEGLQPTDRWLWAPLYPYLLGLWRHLGTIASFKRVQIGLSVATVAMVYGITAQIGTRRAARIAAWGLALHPTVAFFASRLWTETVFLFLLAGALSLALWARRGPAWRGLLLGVALGLCALTRGFGVWMAPVFLLALVWPSAEESFRRLPRWRTAALALVATVLTVAPYSVSASRQHGGLVISDATLGEVSYMGNNDFPLVTWDLGVGLASADSIARYIAVGRPRCDASLPIAAYNRCEVDHSVQWVREHPGAFLARVPQRWAHLLNPNSFLTRHVRLGLWPSVPWWLRELITVWVLLTSALVTWLGTVGLVARGKGPVAVLSAGLALYVFATIGMLFGVSRFRLPLVLLWVPWTAVLLSSPRATWEALRAERWRLGLAVVLLLALIPLVLWHASSGFPGRW